tara:strand:- start:249 stop:968 length:720 start_codon:yes stop_codon:yes gene_type:complete
MSDQRHTVRFTVPHSIVQGQDTTLEAPVYLAGALVAPSVGTVTIYDASNVVLVNAAAVTIVSSVATYPVLTATVAGSTIGAGWRVVWSLTVAAKPLVAENDGALVKRMLYNVVTDADLFRKVPALDPNGPSPITLATNYQDQLDEAWVDIENRMYQEGRRPEWVRSPSSLRAATVWLTLAIIFEDLETRNDAAFEEQAAKYMARYEAAYSAITALLDTDGDGEADTDDRVGLQHAVIWL